MAFLMKTSCGIWVGARGEAGPGLTGAGRRPPEAVGASRGLWSTWRGGRSRFPRGRGALPAAWLKAGCRAAAATARTNLARVGVIEEVAPGSGEPQEVGIVEIYNKYRYDKEKETALKMWEELLLQILAGDHYAEI